MSYTALAEPRQLAVAETALTALLDEPDVAEAMQARRYDAKKVARGRALLEAASAAMGVQAGRTGDRIAATGEQSGRFAEAQALYGTLAATARAVFQDEPEAMTALGLTGEHRKTYEARLERMRAFGAEARKPARLARLAEETEDVDAADFEALDTAVEAAGREISKQDRSTYEAMGSTDARKAAFRALTVWMLKMQGHARVVLKRRPDLLSMLGVPRR